MWRVVVLIVWWILLWMVWIWLWSSFPSPGPDVVRSFGGCVEIYRDILVGHTSSCIAGKDSSTCCSVVSVRSFSSSVGRLILVLVVMFVIAVFVVLGFVVIM